MRMVAEALAQRMPQIVARAPHVVEQTVALDHLLHGERRRARQRMAM